MSDEINCDYTKEIVCPYCGHEHESDGDAYGPQDDDLNLMCRECEKEFIYHTDYDITFCSRIAPCLNNESPHEWRLSYETEKIKIEYCNVCSKRQDTKKEP